MAGPGPIPWTAINEWAKRHGVTDEDTFDDLVVLVRAQDQTWLEYQRDQQDKGNNEPGQGGDHVTF